MSIRINPTTTPNVLEEKAVLMLCTNVDGWDCSIFETSGGGVGVGTVVSPGSVTAPATANCGRSSKPCAGAWPKALKVSPIVTNKTKKIFDIDNSFNT
jgi:hypothetical protein